MPFEIVVNDDASGRALEVEIYNECRHMCSTLIFSSPDRINLGMAAACNRAIALTNSKYVLLLNDDTQMIRPGALRKITKVLDVPYVGCFGPWQTVKNKTPGSVSHCNEAPVSSNGVDFHLSTLPNGAGIFAFRKEVWEQVRGFPQVYTNAGDTCFMIAAMKAGYFNSSAFINDEEYFTNVDQLAGYVDPTAGKSPLDSSYPHIFGMDLKQLVELSDRRRERVVLSSHHQYYAPEGIVAHAWWDQHYFGKAYNWKTHSFDWEVLEQFGQNRWKDEVERDMKVWRDKLKG
jgi:glycosyltransferase involved in cell wall biosynthesis